MTQHKTARSHTVPNPRQWHPAFFATIQIEFIKEATQLTFENEHLISKKPLQIDVVIIKKEKDHHISKNIGRIFRKHNIFEYKGPTDYISIDDFYKVYGYACFYKSDSCKINGIKITEISITFVSQGYPRKLMKHLKKLRNFKINRKYKGIYYVTGDILPIQFIIQSQLSIDENLWLKSLTNKLESDGSVNLLLDDYNKHPNIRLYESAMEMIVRSNPEQFKEVDIMCEALEEIIIEKIWDKVKDEVRNEVKDEVRNEVKDEVRNEVKDEVRNEVKDEVRNEERNLLNQLTIILYNLGRIDDIIKSAKDQEYQLNLLAEFNLI